MWERRSVEGLQTQELPWEIVPRGQLGATDSGMRRVLSRDPSDGAVTTVQRFTGRESGSLGCELDLYVLAGSAEVNRQLVEPGTYLHVPASTWLDVTPQAGGFVAYCGFWGEPTLEAEGDRAATEIERLDTATLMWNVPEWSGDTPLEPGAAVKWLRRDPDAIVYLAGMLPGWKCELEESHPVYEESFKLTGTILMGGRGVIRPGGYFYRQPNVFHGPLYSRDGTMSFIRSNGPTTTEYREVEPERSWGSLARAAYGTSSYSNIV